jgi:hypothetical protein
MLKAMSDLTRGQRESHGDARLTELRAKLRESVGAIISYWEQAPRATTAPVVVRDAIANLAARVDASDAALLRAVERLVRAAMSSVEDERQWTTEPLRALIRFLNVLTRQLRHSPAALDVLQLCRDIRESEAAVNTIDHSSQTRLLAALMVIEDATCAVEGYRALPPFRHVDEAYLAKYGLLQALQLGFDAAEDVGKVLGIRLRADAGERGKVVKMTRNVVAGHPVGGSMQGRAWEHFHDRASVHDKAVMKIMSFASGDSDHWTGQTQLTAQIISDGLTIIGDLLRRSIAELAPDSD